MNTPTAIVIAGALIGASILGAGYFNNQDEAGPAATTVGSSMNAETEARKVRQREFIAGCLQDDVTASESTCLKKANADEEKRRLAEKYNLDSREN